jgi:tetratricopeptide (TPR) repeat protein
MDHGLDDHLPSASGGPSTPEKYNPKVLQSLLHELAEMLRYSPMGLCQIFQICVDIYRYRRNLKRHSGKLMSSETIPITYISRIKELINWMSEFHRFTERELSQTPTLASSYKLFLTLQNVCFEKCGGRILALSRTLEFLAFLSPAMIDFGLIFYWLRPPSTPLLASVQRKWRLPVMSHGDHTARLPFQEAEFEISVECVFPALSPQGVRFSWRVYRTYDKFREAHDLLKSSYSNDMTNYPFPSPNLPFGAPDDVLEEAVSQRRAELSAYISALTNSSNWGRLCLSQAMVNLLGVSDQNHGVLFPKSWIGCEGNGYSSPVTCHESVDFNDQIFIEENSKTIKEDAFFKLIDPLVSVGHLTISKCHLVTKNSSNIEFLNNNSHSSGSPIDSSSNNNRTSSSYFRIYGSVNASLQESVRTWLHSNGRYESILNEVIQFIFIAFKSSHSKFKKDFSVKKSENLIGRISCEQLLPHILSLVTLASPSRATTEYFDLCTLAYHYTSNEGLYHDAVFFATRCIEVITDRPPPVGPGCEQDGLWHGYLADMFFKLSRNEEARTLYEHSLSILRRTCGQYHRHTLSCLERLGRLLYDMGKYKHSVRVLEEALQTSRQIYGRQSDANSQQSSSSSANSLTATTHSLLKYAFGTASSASSASPSPISANSVHIAERINQLVRVMIIDAPDTSVISKCLELKLEELAISRKIRGEYSIAVGRCLNSIGELERKLGRNANALAYFEDSFDILSKSIRKETSPEFISPLYNIGIEKHHLKLLTEAKGFYLRALHLKEIEMSHGGEEEGGDDGGNGNGSIGQRQSRLRGVGVDAQLGNIHDSLGMVYNDLRVYEDSIRHLQAANEIYLQLYGKENHEVAMTYTNLGYVWRCMGNLEVAKSLYTRALTTLKKVGTRSDEDIIARTRNALGELHMDSGNYAEARVLFMESLTMRVSLYGEKHRDTLAVMRNLTVLACKQGQWDEANDICTSVLTLQISLDGYKSVEVAELTGQLAEIMRHLNKIDESKKLFGKAISILKSIYGTNNHPSIAFQMSNLASTLFHCATANNNNASTSNANSSTNSSVLSECEVLYEESRKIYTAAYGNEHVTVAKCYQNLGELSRKKGNIDKALHFHQLCLEIRLRLLGADDPLVASSLHLIADILREKGEVPEAIEIANQSLTTRMKAYGLEHKEVVEGLQLLGQLMERNKQHEEAIRYFRDALRAQSAIDTATMVNQLKIAPQKETIEGSLVTANLIESLVNLMNDSPQSLDEKATLLERCLAIRKHSLGEEHADVAKTLSMLGEICSAKQNYQEAIEFHRIARVIRSKCHGEGHYLSVQSMSAIARNLKQMGRLDEARSIYEQCVINIRNQYDDSSVHLIAPLIDLVDILQLLEQYDALLLSVGEKVYRLVLRVYGENDLQTANCKLRLGDIHRSLGSPEAAKGWYIQALSLFRKLGHLFTEPTILTMEGLVWSLQELGLQEESNALNIELLEIYHRVYGDTHHRVVEELNSFGKMLRSRGNYKEANQYFNRALRIGLSLHGEDHESIIESLDGLAWILDAKGMSSDAKPLRQRIQEIQSRLQASASTSLPAASVPGAASASAPGKTAAALLSNLSLLLSEKSE